MPKTIDEMSPFEKEQYAMRSCHRQLERLTPPARVRVLDYLRGTAAEMAAPPPSPVDERQADLGLEEA